MKVWLLRRAFSGQVEYALVVMSSYRGGGVFQIGQGLEDFLPELRSELDWEPEDILEKTGDYFRQLGENKNDCYELYSSLAT